MAFTNLYCVEGLKLVLRIPLTVETYWGLAGTKCR
jgi:hypothetical protein